MGGLQCSEGFSFLFFISRRRHTTTRFCPLRPRMPLPTKETFTHWRETVPKTNLFQGLKTVGQFIGARLQETHVQEVASSMTLTSVMSIVPLLAVSLAIFSAFPGFADTRQAMEDALFESFLPEQYSEVIVGYLRSFSAHASGLGFFGVAGLAVTSIMLINKLFATINQLFSVTTVRPWMQRLLLYWALLTLGPITIALSLTVSTQIVSSAASGIAPGMLTYALWITQSILQTLAYAFLFRYVPNCFVKWSHALAGGLFVVVVNVFVRIGFEQWVSGGTMGSIYGAFVVIPVLLMWIYVSWYLIFMGAALTATLPVLTSGRFADRYRKGNDFLTGVGLLKVLTQERLADRSVVPLALLCQRVGTYPQQARRILGQLAKAGYCLESANSPSDKNPDWTLVCNPETTTLQAAGRVLLLDDRNELVTPPKKRHGREEGLLKSWYNSTWAEAAVWQKSLHELALESSDQKDS